MNSVAEEVRVIPNRTMEIANLYHKQSLALINLALTQNKLEIEHAKSMLEGPIKRLAYEKFT
jgi:hypothetical protein